MSIFHKHNFQQGQKDGIFIYCSCGKYKDIHSHKWEEKIDILRTEDRKKIGYVLKCIVCGDLKNHYID